MTYLADHVGKCNRLINCGYHYPPRQYFEKLRLINGGYKAPATLVKSKKKPQEPPCGYLDSQYVKKSLEKKRWVNNFTQWLYQLIGSSPDKEQRMKKILANYRLGGSDKIKDAVIFWQIDIAGKVRTGKIMQYNPETGKRIKDLNNPNKINWVHYQLQRAKIIAEDFNLKQCFFGEHLLTKYPDATVAIFESEKTAVVASILFPNLVCLASGGLQGLNPEKCKVLKNRNVIFFPDLKCYSLWEEKVKSISKSIFFANYSINNVLEKNATEEEKEQGLDLCDYIVKELIKNKEC
jgi:hypothetical protein